MRNVPLRIQILQKILARKFWLLAMWLKTQYEQMSVTGRYPDVRRNAKSVGDKIASVRLMYKFIKDFDTHTKIEGSQSLPEWYQLDKRTRKEFCRHVQLNLLPRKGFCRLAFLVPR
jgi:hypothetical protein